MHLSQKHSELTVPLMVGDYCFPKHSDEVDIITALIIRVYPYKLFFCCHVNAKGRDPIVIHRLARFIKSCGLTQFTYRADREPAIMAMIEEACALTGQNGSKDTLADNPGEISQADVIEINDDGAKLADEVAVGNEPHVMSSKEVSSTHTAAPELTHPGE